MATNEITFSVEIESTQYSDDFFIGTEEECREFCKKHDYKLDGTEARIAKIQLDKDGCVVEVLDIFV